MPDPMPQGQAPQGPAPQDPQAQGAPQGQDGKNPMQGIVGLGDAMNQLLPALQKAGAPPEALQKLQEASAAYKDFISILGGNAPSNGAEGVEGEPADQGKGTVPPAAPGQPQMARVKGRNIVPAKGGMGY